MFTVYFTVSVEEPITVSPDELLFVVGSHEKLGNWDANGAFKLARDENGNFTGTVTLNVDVLKFRYFIGYYLEPEHNREPVLVISKWETHLSPRCVMPAVEASKTRVCRANVNDVFGFLGGRRVVSDGWLLNPEQNQILLSISGNALKFYKQRHVEETYRVKVVPLDMRNKHDTPDAEHDDDEVTDDSMPPVHSYSRTEFGALMGDNPNFVQQEEFGSNFKNNVDYLVFRTQTVAFEYLNFRVEVYSSVKNALIAVGYALPSTFHDETFGKSSVPLLTLKGIPVGKLYFHYLFIRPLKSCPTQKMCVSYGRHWKKRTTLEVGHRGMGNSYTKCAVARENTLHSLNSAAKNGADLVEFDVHLSRDKISIIYHDFHVMVSIAKRTPSIHEDIMKCDSLEGSDGENLSTVQQKNAGVTNLVDYYQLAVKDLKLSQLRLLHLEHISHQTEVEHGSGSGGGGSGSVKSDDGAESDASGITVTANNNNKELRHKVTGEHDEAEEHRSFPTLIEAFQNVSEEVGFNVELKYPMTLQNGEVECANYFERNEFLDVILTDVMKAAGNRRIVFSSFDPDICTMISLKQNKYPVLFLCVGESSKHAPYNDDRTRTSMTAVKFAAGMGIMGVNFNSEDLLRDPSPVVKAREYGLISFVWGDELIDKKTVDYFKNTLRVDGVIYDRIGEGEARSNVFSLEKKMKMALFSSKKIPSPVTPPRSSSIPHLDGQTPSDLARIQYLQDQANRGRQRANGDVGQHKNFSYSMGESMVNDSVGQWKALPNEWPEHHRRSALYESLENRLKNDGEVRQLPTKTNYDTSNGNTDASIKCEKNRGFSNSLTMTTTAGNEI